MNVTITLVASGALLLLILILIARKRKTAQLSRALQTVINFAERNGSQISLQDQLNNIAIGLSPRDLKLYFCKVVDDKQLLTEVRIADVAKTSLDKTISARNGSVESICIDFQPKDRTKPHIRFEFYNIDHDSLTLYGELELAEKWTKIVTDEIKRQRIPEQLTNGKKSAPYKYDGDN